MSHIVYLGLGTNIGDRKANIALAVSLLAQQVGVVLRQSADYVSAPVGFRSDNQFLNCVVAVQTELSPTALLDATEAIERQMGRTEKSVNGHYADRVIDIDILLYDRIEWHTDRLQIPHPRMQERDFVTIPLQEIFVSYD